MKGRVVGAFRFVTVLFVTLLGFSVATPQASSLPLAAQLEAYMTSVVEENGFNGVVMIAKGGKPLLSRGYGMANLEWQEPNTPQTVFRLGSLTKPFTALAVVMLRERGELKLSDALCDYLDKQLEACPEAWQTITLRELLTHTSGIPDFGSVPEFASRAALPFTPKELVRRIVREPLTFTPGEKLMYSNTNYYLLGLVVERVSGVRYADFLQQNVFGPLEMTHTSYDRSDRIIAWRASGYSVQEGRLENAAYVDMTNPFASGGLLSTSEDLLRFDAALYTDELISAAARREMFTPTPVGELMPGIGYGYGWGVSAWFERPVLLHNGGISGFANFIARFPARDPSERLTVIVLSNVEQTPADALTNALAGLVLGRASAE